MITPQDKTGSCETRYGHRLILAGSMIGSMSAELIQARRTQFVIHSNSEAVCMTATCFGVLKEGIPCFLGEDHV